MYVNIKIHVIRLSYILSYDVMREQTGPTKQVIVLSLKSTISRFCEQMIIFYFIGSSRKMAGSSAFCGNENLAISQEGSSHDRPTKSFEYRITKSSSCRETSREPMMLMASSRQRIQPVLTLNVLGQRLT